MLDKREAPGSIPGGRTTTTQQQRKHVEQDSSRSIHMEQDDGIRTFFRLQSETGAARRRKTSLTDLES